ncbi:MAG: histidinol-phosphate transaminase, partial [Chloroflexota bacterium]
QTANISRYPDKKCLTLREVLAGHYQVSASQLLAGNGTAELLWLIAFAFLKRNDPVLILEPTFGEYGRFARLMGAKVVEWRARAGHQFIVDLEAVERQLEKIQPPLVHWCSPNNPTGQLIENDVLHRWANQFPETIFVIDEAYAQFLPNFQSAIQLDLPNVIVLRSLTKDYSLAGIRLGVLFAQESIVRGLGKGQPPWSVNGLAQAAGVAAIESQDEYANMWTRLAKEADQFKSGLQNLGYQIGTTPMHYFLMDVVNGRLFRQTLLKHGILVRLCESYQLPNYVRISTQTPDENGRFLRVLGEEAKR